MSKENSNLGAKAQIDFHCPDECCNEVIEFNLSEITHRSFQAVCKKCHNTYIFDDVLRDKLSRMFNLISAIRTAEDLLGDCNVSVNIANASVKVPYALLLTRLNTLLTLELNGKKTDFHLWIEPSGPETFR